MIKGNILARRGVAALKVALLASSLAMVSPAMAQSTSSTVRGTVTLDANVASDAVVTATNLDTGQTTVVSADASGNYVLTGLDAGDYEIKADIGGVTTTRSVSVLVAQSATLDLAANAGDSGDIIVVGNLVETRTSEVATNVTREMLRRLPQTDRNFLSFAQLAPGVQYNDSETNRGFRSGASTASAVNVFIDGVSLKNNVLDQGVAGQQDSRGNPFGQLAVQEFRVLTQNYKAEYEQAAAAIITSTTRSGGNEWHGEAFGSYTDRGMIARNIFDIRAGRPEPEFRRIQYGAALGGPIIEDRLFFFAAYEGNDQNRATNVILGNRSAANIARFGEFEGAFVQPFRGDFFFGKLTWQQDDNNTVDLSFSRRQETDIGGFGGTQSREVAENKINNIDTYLARWTHHGDGFLNEFSLDYLNYNYNPTSLSPDSPTFDFGGVITIGGKDGSQDVHQQNLTIRNDMTFSNIDFAGSHVFKWGLKYSAQDYEFNKLFFVQPRYNFSPADGLNFPFPREALLGIGDPRIAASNHVFGFYAQDDWDVNDRLQINLGLRIDRESNQFNNHYVTPTNAAALLRALPQTSYFNAEDYITDGNDRDAQWLVQPRLGFSYDVSGDERTVVFGGFGRYYDRNVFNNTLDERFRLQYTIGRFLFSTDGAPRDGSPTVVWNESYLTREGLIALQATALTGLPELFAVKNNASAPRTDQFSLGVRQNLGSGWHATVTGSYIRGSNGYTHLFATRNPSSTGVAGFGGCCDTGLANSFGFANVLIGVDELDTRYRALYLQLEHPYTAASGWGFSLAYTLQKAEQNGNDLFSLDKVLPDDFGFRDRAGVERHAIVLSGSVDLPWGFRFSTLSNFGTGQAFQVFDANTAPFFSIDTNRIYGAFPDKNCLGIFARCEVNVTLEKEFQIANGHSFSLALDVFNLFNNRNYTNFNSFVCCGAPPSDFRFGEPNALLTLPRRLQVRAAYRF
ncbi:MAG: carboxypeptidase regulatory-like domain-containing protein [Pseudomonadota bacterium]